MSNAECKLLSSERLTSAKKLTFSPKILTKDHSQKSSPVLRFIKKKKSPEESSSPALNDRNYPDLSNRVYKFRTNGKPPVIIKKKQEQAIKSNRMLINFDSEVLTRFDNFSNATTPVNSINEYEFGLIIGQGTYSIVRKAVSKTTGEIVAIKTYNKTKRDSYEKYVNVNKEINILKTLQHNNIVTILDSIENATDIHIIMEFVPGISLFWYLKQNIGTKIPEDKAKIIISQIFSAVEYLHNNNIAHCDLKLENILITENESIKIIDFGFSEYCDIKKTTLCGSPYYMSPEIVSFEDYYGSPADIWALGIILFTILTGIFPFKGSDNNDLYKKIQKHQPSIPNFVSFEGTKLISRMLKKDWKTRSKIKALINDQWFSSDTSSQEDSSSRLSLNHSLIFERLKRNHQRTTNFELNKSSSAVKKIVKKKVGDESSYEFTSK